MFNINYDKDTGAIISYQEGYDASGNDTPDGCSALSFSAPISGMFHSNGACLMKVDISTGKLVLLNPIEIPDPIPNPENAAK